MSRLLLGNMPITQDELGQRIAAARSRRGLSQGDLAESVGLSQSAISRIESGERSIDSLELAKIAKQLGVSVLDLLEERPLPEEMLQRSARLTEAQDPGAVDVVYRRLVEFLRFDQLLDDIGAPQVPRQEPPGLEVPEGRTPKDQGQLMAERARELLGLGEDPIPSLLEVAEERLGLDVALEPLPSGLAGLCVRTDRVAMAIVDTSAVVGRQRFTIAHEIAHYLAGDGDPFWVDHQLFGRGREETRANAFAAHFLMPAKGIERIIHRSGGEASPQVILEMQYSYRVSLDALLWHLKNLGKISEQRRSWYAESGSRSLAMRYGYIFEWSQLEEMRNQIRPPLRILKRAMKAYGSGLIGIERLADLMATDPDKLRKELEDAGITFEGGWPADTVRG